MCNGAMVVAQERKILGMLFTSLSFWLEEWTFPSLLSREPARGPCEPWPVLLYKLRSAPLGVLGCSACVILLCSTLSLKPWQDKLINPGMLPLIAVDEISVQDSEKSGQGRAIGSSWPWPVPWLFPEIPKAIWHKLDRVHFCCLQP